MEIEDNKQQAQNQQPKTNYFKRQIAIPDWNQDKISNTTALILGAGGMGSCVSIQLMRLGFKKLIMVDNDVVEDHNLSRQIMYTMQIIKQFKSDDIGKSKVEQAKKNLQFHNIANTEIETHHINAVTQWDIVISLAEQSQLIFNLIDYGDYFDIAVSSLCIQLQLPLFLGGSQCNSMTVDYFPANERPCLLCLTDGLKQEFLDKLTPSLITTHKSLEFIPQNDNPEGQANIVTCQMVSNLVTTFVLNELFPTTKKKSKRVLFYLDPFDIVQFDLEFEPKCPYCREPYFEGKSAHEVISEELSIPAFDLWQDIKTLQLQKLFPEMIQEMKVVEGNQGEIDSKFEITYKDGAKWAIQIVEISTLRMAITYDVVQTNPNFSCKKIRNIISVAPINNSTDNSSTNDSSTNNSSEITWRTEFLDDVTINAYEDSQYKKHDYFKNLSDVLVERNKLAEEEKQKKKEIEEQKKKDSEKQTTN